MTVSGEYAEAARTMRLEGKRVRDVSRPQLVCVEFPPPQATWNKKKHQEDNGKTHEAVHTSSCIFPKFILRVMNGMRDTHGIDGKEHVLMGVGIM